MGDCLFSVLCFPLEVSEGFQLIWW